LEATGLPELAMRSNKTISAGWVEADHGGSGVEEQSRPLGSRQYRNTYFAAEGQGARWPGG